MATILGTFDHKAGDSFSCAVGSMKTKISFLSYMAITVLGILGMYLILALGVIQKSLMFSHSLPPLTSITALPFTPLFQASRRFSDKLKPADVNLLQDVEKSILFLVFSI